MNNGTLIFLILFSSAIISCEENEEYFPDISSTVTQTDNSTVVDTDSETIFANYQEYPMFPGTFYALKEYYQKNLKYPVDALESGIEGRVFVQLFLDKKGRVMSDSTKIIRGLGYGMDEEAVRLINNMPPWSPAKFKGEEIKYRLVLPVTFTIKETLTD